jgi:hypothetical protein
MQTVEKRRKGADASSGSWDWRKGADVICGGKDEEGELVLALKG